MAGFFDAIFVRPGISLGVGPKIFYDGEYAQFSYYDDLMNFPVITPE
jgi:hypothetical protein